MQTWALKLIHINHLNRYLRCLTFTSMLAQFVSFNTAAQAVLYGQNNYIEYQVGTLPLIISVSHGGTLEPNSIPNRSCNNAVNVTDAFTIETALEIKNKLFAATGCYPHLIISHLKRNKLDPNRNLTEATCGNQEAATAWHEFHNFLTTARNAANQQYNHKTFFVDLHGHGNPIQRIELGYLLYADELALPDAQLNTPSMISHSSIKNLVAANQNNYTHAQLIRGPFALGSLLAQRQYPSVPSENTPFPGINANYFSGGYITANHTCYHPAAAISGLQMELNYTAVRDLPSNRSAFAAAFTDALISYLQIHLAPNWQSCTPVSLPQINEQREFSCYPNPVKRGEALRFALPDGPVYHFEIRNQLGQLIKYGAMQPHDRLQTHELIPGIHTILIFTEKRARFFKQTLVVQ